MPRDLRIEDAAQERRVIVDVKQVERPVARRSWSSSTKSIAMFSDRFNPAGVLRNDEAPRKWTPTSL